MSRRVAFRLPGAARRSQEGFGWVRPSWLLPQDPEDYTMTPMRYVGPEKTLRDKTALVREHPDHPSVLAQFDGKDDWRLPEEFKLRHPQTGAFLCYGWHEFSPGDFGPI